MSDEENDVIGRDDLATTAVGQVVRAGELYESLNNNTSCTYPATYKLDNLLLHNILNQ